MLQSIDQPISEQRSLYYVGSLVANPRMNSDNSKNDVMDINREELFPGEDRHTKEVEESQVCPVCFGTGMEVVPGKGARPCRCRRKDRRAALLLPYRTPPLYGR